MLINDSTLLTVHSEIAKKKALNTLFDSFCMLIINSKSDIARNAKISPNDIYARLEIFLKKNMLIDLSKSDKSFIGEDIGEALYAMCALADEAFLTLQWEGRDFWAAHLLESAFFNTHISGEEIFRRIDLILEEGNAIYADLGEIYLKMLALGYSGKYMGDLSNKIYEYRDRLYQYILHSDHTAEIVNDRLFDEEYANIMASVNRQLLPDPHVWNRMIAMYLVCFTIIGIILWNINIHPIFSKVSEIEEIATYGTE